MTIGQRAGAGASGPGTGAGASGPGTGFAAGTDPGDEEAWYDEDAGPVVRPYAMTSGRTRPVRPELDLISQVKTRPAAQGASGLSPEQTEIIERCRRPLSVAEIGAAMNLPVGTVRVLVGDLLQAGLVETREPPLLTGMPSQELLEAILAGLRAL
nr:DUF742 domain-containing protein [Micromonospora sp. DSM 115978]